MTRTHALNLHLLSTRTYRGGDAAGRRRAWGQATHKQVALLVLRDWLAEREAQGPVGGCGARDAPLLDGEAPGDESADLCISFLC